MKSTNLLTIVTNFHGHPSMDGMWYLIPEISTTNETMGVDITTIAYLRILIIENGSTIILMVVEAQVPSFTE